MAPETSTSVLCAKCGEPSPREAPTCANCGAEVLLDGRYRLDALIGRGAMGITYRATRMADGAVVAVKELPFHRVDTLKTTELFEREATILRALAHPSIPAWFDHFTVGTGKQLALCLVQEFIDGDTVQALFAAKRPTEREILVLMRELLETLIHLGDLRPPIVHRDIKPQNLMRRRRDGSLVLIDFGSVRDAVRDDLAGGPTVAGTFGYMAPEQFAGYATSATDLYGAGATALALLAGSDAAKLLGRDGALDWQGRVVMSDGLRGLLIDMLAAAPEDRPTARVAHARVLGLLESKVVDDRLPPQISVAPTPASPTISAPRIDPGAVHDDLRIDPHGTPDDTRKVSRIYAWVLALIVLGLFGVMALLPPNSGGNSGSQPARPLAPSVSPPFGLAFGMSLAEASKTWPALASAEELPPERLSISDALTLDALNNSLVDVVFAETPPIPGVARAATARFGSLEGRCEVRFASVASAAEPGLVAFECELGLERVDEATAAAQTLIRQWTERFGAPTMADSTNGLMDPGLAGLGLRGLGRPTRWQSAEASVEIEELHNGVALRGQTDAWRDALQQAQQAAAEAWRRERARQSLERQREIQRALEGVERP